MHSDHSIFVLGIQKRRKIKLTYFDNEIKLNFTKLSIPLHYRSPRAEGDYSDCYYFWVPEADADKHFLCLSPSQIVSMDLTDEAFDPGKLTINEGGMANNQTEKQNIDSKSSMPKEPTSETFDQIAKLAKHLAAKIKANGLSKNETRSVEGDGNGRQNAEAMQKIDEPRFILGG